MKFIKLRSIVKKWRLEKIKTKNIIADWRKLKSKENVLHNFCGSPATTLETTQSLKVKEDYKALTAKLNEINTIEYKTS